MRTTKGFAVFSLLVLAVALTAPAALFAAQVNVGAPMGRGAFIPLNGQIAGAQLLPVDAVLTDASTDDDAPSIGAGQDGRIALAWVAFDDKADRVLCCAGRAGDGGKKAEWGQKEEVAGPGDYFHPAAAFDGQGGLWILWSANLDGQYDLFARRKTASGWEKPVRLTETPGSDFASSMVSDAKGRIWIAWQGVRDGNFEILLAELTATGLQDIRDVSSHPANDWAPCLAIAPSGKRLVAWDTYRNGSYDVYLREVGESGMSEPVPIAASAAREANASVAVDKDGVAWIAYDVAEENWGRHVRLHGQRSIGLRSYKEGLVGKPAVELASSLSSSLRAKIEQPKIAFDKAGWLHMAFMRFIPQDSVTALKGKGAGAIQDTSGDDFNVGDEEAAPAKQTAAKGKNAGAGKAGTGKTGNAKAGQAKANAGGGAKGAAGKAGAGAGATAAKKQKGAGHGIFFLYATSFDGKSWRTPKCLAQSSGRGEERFRLTALPNGDVWAAWGTDGRQFPYYEVRINGDICAARVDSASPALGSVSLPIADAAAPSIAKVEPDTTAARERKPKVALGGEQYILLMGDTHRHTDISRCNLGGDSTLAETYRYGIDVAGLDFLSVSDHDQDLAGWRFKEPSPKLKNYWWWNSQKMADLYTIPGRFFGMYGYERGRQTNAGGGHKNIISLKRGVPDTSGTEPAEWFAELTEKDSVIIPHQLADGPSAADWNKWSEPFERVAEIFQARGSYEYLDAPLSAKVQKEGYCLWDALDKGVRVGTIASSDHGLTHSAYAGVFAKGFTRADILEGLYQRRTFGATTPLQLLATLNGVPMGQEIACAAAPVIKVAAASTEPIEKVEIVKDRKFVYSKAFSGKSAEFEFEDSASEAGKPAYYYVRVTMGGNEMAWSSPFWVKRN